jgi:hypothetical protein
MKYVPFGDDSVGLIYDLDLKNKIIDYLFNTIDLKNFRFNMLENIKQLETLQKNPHYVSPNFRGYSYYLLFLKINNIQYCIAIDKRKLSYHKEKINIRHVIMYSIKINTFNTMYRGSIFDSKLIKYDNNHTMLINDCYILMGNNLLTMNLNDKMKYISGIFKNKINNNSCSNFSFRINKLFKYEDLKNLINNIIPSSKLDTNGIVFFPEYSGISKIFINKPQKIKEKIEYTSNENVNNESYQLIKDFTDFLKARSYSYENGKTKKLLLEKTNITDVYNIYTLNEKEKLGIAHIPNLRISSLCNESFKDSQKNKFNCVYNDRFKKWTPLNLI